MTSIHRGLRPTFGCHYFANRHVKRRTEDLARTLEARIAVGEADENDRAELEALRTFRSSLMPAPSRGWTVAGLIAAIVLSQALLGWLMERLEAGESTQLKTALNRLSLTPDVRSVGDLGRALTSAGLLELGVVVITAACVLYLFARPLASGYRLAQLCLGQRARLSRRRRDSPLCQQAAQLAIPAHEAGMARVGDVAFPRLVPMDLVVKAAPWMAATYAIVGLTRAGGQMGVSSSEAAWVASSAVVVAALARLLGKARLRRAGWRRVRVLVAFFGSAALFVLLVGGAELGDQAADVWLVIFVATVLRLVWVARELHGGGQSLLWIAAPLALILATATVARYEDAGGFAEGELEGVVRQFALLLRGRRRSAADEPPRPSDPARVA